MIARKPKSTPKNGTYTPDGTCACGCGGATARNFQPGHDQRLIGELAAGLAAGELDTTHLRLLGLPDGWGRRSSYAARTNRVVTLVSQLFTPALAAKLGCYAAMRKPE